MNSSSLGSLTVQLETIPRGDRWQVYQRLQSLNIACHCSPDGGVAVEINSPTALAQLSSVVKQLTASRSDLISWLECCWHTKP